MGEEKEVTSERSDTISIQVELPYDLFLREQKSNGVTLNINNRQVVEVKRFERCISRLDISFNALGG